MGEEFIKSEGKRSFTQNMASKIKKMAGEKRGRNNAIYIGAASLGIILIVVVGAQFGWFSIFAPKPPIEEDVDQYIGFYTISVLTSNPDGEERVDATIKLFDYYTDEEIGTILADGETVYETTNVTLAMVYYVHDGNKYPNASFVIFANQSESTPHLNNIFLNPIGNVSNFSSTIIETESNGVYGASLPELTIENFTMNMRFRNNGSGEFGYHYYIPEPYRTNDLCGLGALWLKVDTEVLSLRLGRTKDTMVLVSINYTYAYDDINGNSYILLPTLYANDIYDYWLYMECLVVPTQMDVIQGSWDGDILKTFT